MSRPKAPKASVPSGTDETRLVTLVREQWHKYQGQEKRFSKDFALALIALHKKLAKPHCGLFQDKLKELKIPRSTAYRVMGLHGCKAEKRDAKKSQPIPEELRTLARSKAVTAAIGFFSGLTGDELRKQFEGFVTELRREVFAEASKESEVA